MTHPITKRLLTLPILEGKDDHAEIVIAASNPDHAKGGKIHGFAALITLRSGRPFTPLTGGSDTPDSTDKRGDLAALLTSLEWLNINANGISSAKIYSRSDYIYRWIKQNIKRWVGDTSGRGRKRANLDLLALIDQALGDRHIADLQRVPPSLEPNVERAKMLARSAAKWRSTTLPREPEGIWLSDDNVEFDEEGFHRALARDST